MIYFERRFKPLREKFSLLNFKPLNWAVTLLLSMLAWIPFRAENLRDTLVMYRKIITPSEYLTMSLKENNYLITFLILILILLAYYATFFIEPKLKPYKHLSFLLNVLKFIIIIIFVFTFLRPISQFIYFQF
jgi:alginate O-acetyltransferase complex protein AlgI